MNDFFSKAFAINSKLVRHLPKETKDSVVKKYIEIIQNDRTVFDEFALRMISESNKAGTRTAGRTEADKDKFFNFFKSKINQANRPDVIEAYNSIYGIANPRSENRETGIQVLPTKTIEEEKLKLFGGAYTARIYLAY